MRKNCDVCDLDVSAMVEMFHDGYCPVCETLTTHVRADVPNCPWVCKEPHADDATACAACGAVLTDDTDGGFVLAKSVRKKICVACNPFQFT